MALESVTAAETLIQSNAENDDLEDGEIPSDEDDEPTPPPAAAKSSSSEPSNKQQSKPSSKPDSPKHKPFDSKFSNKSKKPSSSSGGSGGSSSKQDRFGKYKNPSEDWAGDVEKAIRAALEEQADRSKNQDSKSKSKSNRSKNRKRAREEKEEERAKEQKKRKMSDEENGHEDDDEMLFVRGASPVSRRDGHDTTRSPPRRSSERDNYDNLSDNDDRQDRRQRDNDNKRGAGGSGGGGGSGGRGSGRRGGKIDRGGKNKGRQQLRNDRNGRRNQNNDHGQDPESICLYYMQGKCHRGDDCPFSHNALPPRKMELCKFYLMDCCAKRDKCLYMHHDFPCKFFHTGLKCTNAENCKFSHQPLNEQVKNILLKHLETAPKEILGDFPRLSREGALLMINNTARNLAQNQGQEPTNNQKIPSLFDVALPAPANPEEPEHEEPRINLPPPVVNEANIAAVLQQQQQKRPASSGTKERKPAGKKTRWGSDEDRVPYEQIMLLQSVSQLGLHLPNVALGLAVQQRLQQHILLQQCIANMEFYNEINGSPPETGVVVKDKDKDKEKEDFTKDVEEDEILAQANANADDSAISAISAKDVDLRQLLAGNRATTVTSIAEDAASLEASKFDDESDRDEEANLVIEMPVEEEEKDKDEEKDKEEIKPTVTENDEPKKEKSDNQEESESASKSSKSPAEVSSSPSIQLSEEQEMPPNLPKKAQELFMRIQQQQRTAKDSLSILDEQGEVSEMSKNENWYSDEDEDGENDDDDDDDEAGNLTIVLKDSQKDESEDLETPEEEKPQKSLPEPSAIPQPAVFVDKLGDLSKIDISAEVSKLLSSIKPQASKSRSEPQQQSNQDTKIPPNSRELSGTSPFSSPRNAEDLGNNNSKMASNFRSNPAKTENGSSSPRASSLAPVSRDPRMSRDPRQRRDEQKSLSPTRAEPKKDSRPLRHETSIYSSGITAMDAAMDTDLRARLDQDHRRKDMDLRQRFQQQDFGDTDLRVVGTNFGDTTSSRSDVDLRQMLSLPFKPAPSHVPCTEIDASATSHPPVTYKVYVVDIPRPDYTGLKLTKNDAQVKYDPRLRKIFRLPKVDIADSPMSPPPASQSLKQETPKSPPPVIVRTDPRRKALEPTNNQGVQNVGVGGVGSVGMMGGQGGQVAPQVQQQQQPDGMGGMVGMGVQGMQGPPGMGGIPSMGQNPIMGGMGPMGGMMGGPMAPQNMPMGMGPGMGNGPNMGPQGNGPNMGPPNQMSYDPRYAQQRNGGPGLLGPAPGMGYGPDVGPTGYDGPQGYPGPGNFGNYGPGGPADPGMMGFGPNGPNSGSFGGNVPPAEWSTGNQNNMRRGSRIRRRNRNRTNGGPNNRGNRSPP